jgi:hypothetical protein
MEQQTYQYKVPKVEYEARTIQVPTTVMVPQTTFENRVTYVPRHTFEMKTATVQVPRMTEGIQNVVSYHTQTVQEPVQIMVPQAQTVNTVQQVNRVVEYARTPVRQYSVVGPTAATAASLSPRRAPRVPYYDPGSWQEQTGFPRPFPVSLY